jgi:ABC-type phosphate transport system substrate-binding protein
VSPVVATLILILIAVAAAAALYLWLVGWQGSVTGSISKPGVNQGSFTIGGSTSVYPFSSLAVTWYEQNNTGVTISDTQGGSTAGALSVCSGGVDVGAVSAPFTASTLIANDGCPASDASTITVTTIAYDAVDVIVGSANDHGLLSINYDTLALAYQDASIVASGGTAAKLITTTEDGGVTPIPTGVPTAGSIAWDQIPATVSGYQFAIGALTNNNGTVKTNLAIVTEGVNGFSTPVQPKGGQPCGLAKTALTDICDNVTLAGVEGGTPCGFFVCAGGLAAGTTSGDAGAAIQTVARSDGSGTTQAFEARLIDAKSSTAFAAQSNLEDPLTGFTGCGGNNLISDCGYVATNTGNGNPGVISQVASASNPDQIGYASDGLARAAGSGVHIVSYLGVSQTVQTTNYGGVLPTTGSSGTIALGIQASTNSADYGSGYLGWRPFDLITLAPPSGLVLNYLNFVLQTGVNTELATVTAEVSLYSV